MEAALQGRRCLIVDEKAINRKVLAHQLATQGILYESVEDGVRALDRLRTAAAVGAPFDLAILDLHMSVMGGLELARRIKEDSAICSVRLVLLASLGRRGDAKIAQEAGIAAYLTKPIRQAQLTACLSAVMGQVVPPVPIITRHSVAEAQTGLCGRVLIADDNPISQKVAAQMVEKLGCSVDIAANGREALEAVARTKYDAVLMDCQMPDINGFDAAAEIRRREGGGSHVPIIAMTANTACDDRVRSLAAGMDDFLSKPFEAKAFAEMLARWVVGSEKNSRTIRCNPLHGPSADSFDDRSARQREPECR
jgi:CheY-like chemotaxis protein